MPIFTAEWMARIYCAWMALCYAGATEGSQRHLDILAAYNSIKPLPRGYKVSKTDAWCAVFVSAIAWLLGMRKAPFECSVPWIVQAAKRRGIWHQGWAVMPDVGDWCVYDWRNDGTVDHIGIVVAVIGNKIVVCEGNYEDSVKIRILTVGDERVEGFVALDFRELVQGEELKNPALLPGDSGEEVRKLQFKLGLAGYYVGNLDGDYGANTTRAVTEFQAANNLEPDGKCGPKTQAVLDGWDFKLKKKELITMEPKRYQRIDEMPEWAKPTIAKLVEQKRIQGDEAGNLNLSLDMIRMFVVNDRAGLYDM